MLAFADLENLQSTQFYDRRLRDHVEIALPRLAIASEVTENRRDRVNAQQQQQNPQIAGNQPTPKVHAL
jgi:hypothetical protein